VRRVQCPAFLKSSKSDIMNLVSISNSSPFQGKLTTTSLQVAEFFGKEHKNVLRDIKHLIDNIEMGMLNFELTPYEHPQNGQTYHYYEMTEEGFTLLVMGYTGKEELKFKQAYIKAFSLMRELLSSDDYIVHRSFEIMQKRLDSAQEKVKELTEKNEDLNLQNQLQQTTIAAQAPVVEYATTVLSAKNAWTITTIAKELGMSARKLNKILEAKKVQYKADHHYVLYSKYQDCNYTKTKTHTYTDTLGQPCTNMQTVWTELGRQFIHGLMKESASVKVQVFE